MAKKHGPNKENLEATRRNFMKIARHEFSTKGYYNASTALIVDASGMARGSLYYHFGDKKGLFRAVYEELMHEMRATVANKIMNTPDPWEAFVIGCLSFLDLYMDKQTRRIIIDVNTALTYAERIEILKRTLMEELRLGLQKAIDAGYFKGHNIDALTVIIFGFISEAGRSFELSDDVRKSRDNLSSAFRLLMQSARA